MEIQSGTILKVFKNERTIKKEGKDVIQSSFRTSLSKKVEDKYHYYSVQVRFIGELAKKSEKMKVDKCYTLQVNKAFLSFDEWFDSSNTKRTSLVILITDAKVTDTKDVTKKEQEENPDIPF